MKEIIELSGACRDQTRIRIKLAFSGKLKELILDLLNENFYLRVDDQGFLTGELAGTFDEISKVIELLKIKGFKFQRKGGVILNKKQKMIIAIAVPIILFLITFTIAYYIGETTSSTGKIGMGGKLLKPATFTKTNNPFLWSLTWHVWITYFIIIFIFEYKFFSDKNIPNNKKK